LTLTAHQITGLIKFNTIFSHHLSYIYRMQVLLAPKDHIFYGQDVYLLNFTMLCNLSSTECRVFHDVIFYGSCDIHVWDKRCA